MKDPAYAFVKQAGRIINSGQTRALCLTGNIMDLFHRQTSEGGEYIPLVELLVNKWALGGTLVVVYELNGPIRFQNQADLQKMRDAWGGLHTTDDQRAIDLALARTQKRITELQKDAHQAFDASLRKAAGNPTYALEFLRQICLCSRLKRDGVPLLWEDLVILIEGAEFLIPAGEIAAFRD